MDQVDTIIGDAYRPVFADCWRKRVEFVAQKGGNWTASVEIMLDQRRGRWNWYVQTLGQFTHTVAEGSARSRVEAARQARAAADSVTPYDLEATTA